MPQIDTRLESLAHQLEKQSLNSSHSDGTIRNVLGLSKTTFYRLKPRALEMVHKWASDRQQAIALTKTQETIEAVKQGLKSKSERVMILQKEIDACLNELYDPQTPNYSMQGQALKQVGKMLTVLEKVKLRQTIREMQAEISKIEGDYAPVKTEDVTDYQVIRPKRR